MQQPISTPGTAIEITPSNARNVEIRIAAVEPSQPERFGYRYDLIAGGRSLAFDAFYADADAAQRAAERKLAEIALGITA